MICTEFVLSRGGRTGHVTNKKCRREQFSNPIMEWTNGVEVLWKWPNLLQKPSNGSNGKKKKRKVSHILADYYHKSIQHNFSMKFLLPEMINMHELALLMSFKAITLQTAGNNAAKQINYRGIVNMSQDVDMSFDVVIPKRMFLSKS